jgi:hypothetical protein
VSSKLEKKADCEEFLWCVASLNIQLFLLYYSKYTLYLKETNDSFSQTDVMPV